MVMRARVWASTPPPEKSTIPQIPHIRKLPPWGLGSRDVTRTSDCDGSAREFHDPTWGNRPSARTAVRGVSENAAPRTRRVVRDYTRHALTACPVRRVDVREPRRFVRGRLQSKHPWKGNRGSIRTW